MSDYLNLNFSFFRKENLSFFFNFINQDVYRFCTNIFALELGKDHRRSFFFLDSGFKRKDLFYFFLFFKRNSLTKLLRRLVFHNGLKFLIYNSFFVADTFNKFSNSFFAGYFPLNYFNFYCRNGS